MSRDNARGIINELKAQVLILGGTVALMWIMEFFDLIVFRGGLDKFGIIPGSAMGLRGILFAPFLHGDFLHLAANTIPFVTLGWLIMLRETSDFFIVSAISMIVSGLGVWLFAPPNSIHIGASGVVFGYLGYLVFRGYFQRSPGSILLSLIVLFIYGSMIWGVLPSEIGISWQGHLFGFVGGAIAARLLSGKKH
ncbi:MAG: rhomboid family intramembrane serine protease [Phormidium sp.]